MRDKIIRMPEEAYESYRRKLKQMEEMLNKDLKKPVKLKFSDGLRFFSQRPVFVYNDEVIKFFVKKKR